MKKLLMILVGVGLILGIVACGEKDNVTQEEVKYTSKEVYDKIVEGLEFPAQDVISDEMFVNTYKIRTDLLADYIVMQPMTSVHANEMAVLKVKDENDVDTVKKALEERANTLKEQTLYPEQKDLVQNYKIVSKGKYILYVVDKNADTIVKNFEALLK